MEQEKSFSAPIPTDVCLRQYTCWLVCAFASVLNNARGVTAGEVYYTATLEWDQARRSSLSHTGNLSAISALECDRKVELRADHRQITGWLNLLTGYSEQKVI